MISTQQNERGKGSECKCEPGYSSCGPAPEGTMAEEEEPRDELPGPRQWSLKAVQLHNLASQLDDINFFLGGQHQDKRLVASAQRSGLCHLPITSFTSSSAVPSPSSRPQTQAGLGDCPPSPCPINSGLHRCSRGSGTQGSPRSAGQTRARCRPPHGIQSCRTETGGTMQPCWIDGAGGQRCWEQLRRRAPRLGSAPVPVAVLRTLVPEAGAPAASSRCCHGASRPELGWLRAARTGIRVLLPPRKAWGAFLGTAIPCDREASIPLTASRFVFLNMFLHLNKWYVAFITAGGLLGILSQLSVGKTAESEPIIRAGMLTAAAKGLQMLRTWKAEGTMRHLLQERPQISSAGTASRGVEDVLYSTPLPNPKMMHLTSRLCTEKKCFYLICFPKNCSVLFLLEQ